MVSADALTILINLSSALAAAIVGITIVAGFVT